MTMTPPHHRRLALCSWQLPVGENRSICRRCRQLPLLLLHHRSCWCCCHYWRKQRGICSWKNSHRKSFLHSRNRKVVACLNASHKWHLNNDKKLITVSCESTFKSNLTKHYFAVEPVLADDALNHVVRVCLSFLFLQNHNFRLLWLTFFYYFI